MKNELRFIAPRIKQQDAQMSNLYNGISNLGFQETDILRSEINFTPITPESYEGGNLTVIQDDEYRLYKSTTNNKTQ